MTIPNLGGVIKAEDVFEKGSGSYTASYVAWAKTSQLLRDHAPGWGFHLEPKNEEYVWKAPDGSGYLMCYFRSNEEETRTSLFPFPIMDNRNNPIQCEKISARVFTDSHRRALCACAAFTFGLAYELWAKEEIESLGATPVKPVTKAKTEPVKSDLKTVFLKKLKDPDSDSKKIIAMAEQRHKEGQLSKDDLTEIKLAV